MQHCYRTVSFKAMVREDQTACRRSNKSSRREKNKLCSAELGKDLLRMDVQYTRLVHFATALVGTQDSGILLQGMRAHNRYDGRSEPNAANAGQKTFTRMRMFSIHGSHPRCGRSPQWAGRTARQSLKNIIPQAFS